MPLPKAVARFNKRFTNRLIEPFVARTSTFAIVEHIGRRSGVTYRTPINLFPCGDGYVAALTYGTSADWVRNVRSGRAVVELGRQQRQISSTELVDRTRIWACLPSWVRAAMRILRIHHFLLVSVAGPKASQ